MVIIKGKIYTDMQKCPLCNNRSTGFYTNDTKRDYYTCNECGLVFVPADQHLDPQAEKARYDLHQNTADDKGYVTFLNRLVTPVKERVKPGKSCLDFGSGPSPVLAQLLTETGYQTTIYDPFYANNPDVFSTTYDAVTCCEVAEHLSKPGEVFQTLMDLLNPGGWLAVMTQLIPPKQEFNTWSYKNDLTHVCFYSPETFSFIADMYSCTLEMPGRDVILLNKKRKIKR